MSVVGAVGMVARAEIRRRWRGAVVLTLLVAVVGAVVLATVAGARRTDSALGRFNAYSRSSDVEIQAGNVTPAELRTFERVPGVRAVAVLNGFFVNVRGAPNLAIAAAVDAKLGTVVDRARLISGRRPHLSAADEVTIGEGLAAQLHKRVGDHLDVSSFTPAQAEVLLAGGDGGPPAGPRLRIRIVGIVRRPLDLGDRGASGGVVVLTPAFVRQYSGRIFTYGSILRIRTNRGAADVPRVVAAARRIFPAGRFGFSVQGLAIEKEGARSAIDVLTVALWVFAGVALVAGLVAIGITLTREISQVGFDQSTLRALGFTRGQRIATSGPPALLIAGAGAVLAAVGAVAASPLFPIGVARRAEPDLGLRVDWPVEALGIIAVVAIVVTIASVAALRSAQRLSSDGAPRARARPSPAVALAAGAGLPPTATNGLRMAFEPGRGPTAVPVRSAFLGAVLGVLGVIAVLMFASSLDHLAATPRLYGWAWDFAAHDSSNNQTCNRAGYGITGVRGVAAVAAVCYQNMEIDRRPVIGWSFKSVRGTIGPEVVAGRAPRGAQEVALGSVTLDALGKRIGDTVKVAGPHGGHGYRVVGRIVFPKIGEPQPLADGAVFTSAGFSPIFDSGNYSRYLVGRFSPGSDPGAVARRIRALSAFRPQGRSSGSTLDGFARPAVPPEVDHLRQIDWFPATLAALLTGLALIALGHALVTAVRRRRGELAVLKTLGFARRQLRATIAWQATMLAAVGLVIGIPLGLIVGRFAWHLVADGLGVSTVAAIPVLALALSLPCVIALVNVLALLPARAAAHTQPAVALRSE